MWYLGSSGATKLAKKEPKSTAQRIAAKVTEDEKEKGEKKQEEQKLHEKESEEEEEEEEKKEKKSGEKKTGGKKAAAPKKTVSPTKPAAYPEVAPKSRANKTKVKATTKVIESPNVRSLP